MYKKLLLVTSLFVTLFSYSAIASETPCDKGNCGDNALTQGQTNANNPNFISQPNMNMSGSNIAIQNNIQSVSRFGDSSCQNDTISVNGYRNVANSETLPVSYENKSDSWGMQLSVNIVAPWDKANKNCLNYQEKILIEKNDKLQQENIRLCVDMINNGFILSDQLKSSSPQLALCDHIRKVRDMSPERYREMISRLQQQNIQLKKEIPVERVVVGYKEYRVRFLDYINKCSENCNGKYKTLSDYIKDIKSNFGDNDYKIYATPYDNGNRVSVYLRNNMLSYNEAELHRQRFVVAGFAAKIQGVRGTEVYKK